VLITWQLLYRHRMLNSYEWVDLWYRKPFGPWLPASRLRFVRLRHAEGSGLSGAGTGHARLVALL